MDIYTGRLQKTKGLMMHYLFTLFCAALLVMPGKAAGHEFADGEYAYFKTEGDCYEGTPVYILSDNKTIFWGGCRFFHLDSMSFSKKCDLIGTPEFAVASPKRNRLLVTASIPRKTGDKVDYISYMYDLPSKKILYKWPNRKFKVERFHQVALNPDGSLIATSEQRYPGEPGASNSFFYLFDLQLNRLARVNKEDSEMMYFSEDGKKLITIGRTKAHIYCLDNNKLRQCGEEDDLERTEIFHQGFSPNKRYISEPDTSDFSRDSRWVVDKIKSGKNNEDGIVVRRLPAASPPSFDCIKATGPTERLICSDETLSRLDFALAKNFAIMRAATQGETRERLLVDQRAWFKESRICENVESLIASYTKRIEELCKNYPVKTGKQPECVRPPSGKK